MKKAVCLWRLKTREIVLTLISLLTLILSNSALAVFYFDRDIEYLNIDLSNWPSDNVEASIVVNFRSFCFPDKDNSTCNPSGRGQQYQLGISDQGDTSRPTTILPSLNIGNELKKLVKNFTVSVGSDITDKVLLQGNKARWVKSGNLDEPAVVEKSAVFSMRLHKQKLQDLADSAETFSIFIYGVSEAPLNYQDVLEVRIRADSSTQVKISQLKDIQLTEDNIGSGRAVNMEFCVYVSGSLFAPRGYFIRANGLHEDNSNNFNLKNGDNTAVYKMSFHHRPWILSGWEGPEAVVSGASIKGRGSIQENCENYSNTINARLSIYLESNPSAAGVYSDTVTLTVIPE